MATTTNDRDIDTNPDAITGAPGSHPAGTGIGAASGAATGAAVGAIGGPVGAVIGAVAGGITGGLIGHGIGEAVDPTAEEAYWRENYKDASYTDSSRPYEDYQHDYSYGYTAGSQHGESKTYEQAEPTLRADYDEHHSSTTGRKYDEAKHAVKDAYNRVRPGAPGYQEASASKPVT